MAGNKVKFHSLERLDLNDIEAIQDNVEIYDLQSLGELVGAEGLLSTFATPVINNTENYFTLTDFTVLTRGQDTLKRGDVCIYDNTNSLNNPSSNRINFTSFKAVVQSYYNSASLLPTAPSSESFNELTGRVYYPFIWARSIEVETSLDTRRFWSVSLGQEVSDTVSTEKVKAVQIIVSATKPLEQGGLPWGKIGQIYAWSVTGGVVSLQTIKPYLLADNLLVTPSQSLTVDNFGYTGGIKNAFSAITTALTRIQDGGTNDTDSFPAKSWHEAPVYSLSGLRGRIDDVQASTGASIISLNKKLSRATISYLYSYNSIDNINVFFGKNDLENNISISGDVNYTYAAAAGVAPGTALSSMSSANRSIACANLVIKLPESALGKRIESLNCYFVSPNFAGDLMAAGGNGLAATTFPMNYLRYLSDDASLVYNNFTYIREETYKDVNHNSITGPAILLNLYPSAAFTASDMRFNFQIELIIDMN